MRSAFGIRHSGLIGKAGEKHKTDPARLATGALFPGAHGAIAGRRGRKLRAAGHEVGGSVVGSVVPGPGTLVGGAVGTHYADKKGYYKPIKKDQGLSAFGIEHAGIVKGIRPDKTIDAAIAAGKKVKPKPVPTPLADARFGPRIQKSAFGIEHAEAVEKGLRHYLHERRRRKDRGRQTRATLEHLTTGGPNADGVWTLKPGAADVLHHHAARHGAHTSAWPRDARSALGKSAFGIVHKGPLAAADDVASAPGKVKAVTGTVRSGVAVPASASSPRKPLAQKLNDAVAATGGSQT